MFLNILRKKDEIIKETSEVLIRICLYSLVFFLPLIFWQTTRDNINFPKEYLLYFFVSLSLVIFLFSSLFLTNLKIRKSYLDIPILIFVVFVCLSAFFSLNPRLSFWGRPDLFLNYGVLFIFLSLFFWMFNQFIFKVRYWQFILIIFLLSNLTLDLVFWFAHWWPSIFSLDNLISRNYSSLSLFNAIGLILGVAILGVKKDWFRKIIALVVVLTAISVLFRLGFILGWVAAAVGLGLLLILTVVRWQKESFVYFLLLFVLFATAFICAIVGSPDVWKLKTPAEISLGQKASWDVVKQASLSKATHLFLGTGLGTFSYSFASFREPSFNFNQITENINFSFPFSTLLSVVSELGIIGSVIFVLIILLTLGSLPVLILHHIRPILKTQKIEIGIFDQKVEDFRWEIIAVFTAWLCLTGAMAFVYVEAVLWFVWWLFLAVLTSGFGILNIKGMKEEKTVSISLKHPYTLLKSFSVLLILTMIISFGIYSVRFYLAEANYLKYIYAADKVESKTDYLERANKYRDYSFYLVELAQNKLKKAAEISRVNPDKTEDIVNMLGQAIESGKKAVNVDPANYRVWENIGSIYFNAAPLVKDADKWAKDSFDRALALVPSNPVLYWELGNSQLLLDDKEAAEKSFKKAIELKPDFIEAYISLAGLYEENKKADEAIAVYRGIPSGGQNDAQVLFNYGRLLFNRNEKDDWQNAEQIWLAALSIKPDFTNVWYSLAVLYERQGKINKAKEYYNKVKELDPVNESVEKKLKTL